MTEQMKPKIAVQGHGTRFESAPDGYLTIATRLDARVPPSLSTTE